VEVTRASVIAYTLIGVSVSAAQSVAPQDQPLITFGEGLASCGVYVEAITAERKAKQPGDSPNGFRTSYYGSFMSFADGFITGSNYSDLDHRLVGENTDIAGRMTWLENYCRSNPLNGFVAAVVALRKFLINSR
jgi:hypothetical protein